MGRACFKCGKDIIIGKTITASEKYEGLNEVEIHTECYRCKKMKKTISQLEQERRELGKKYRELSSRIKTYKELLHVVSLDFLKSQK